MLFQFYQFYAQFYGFFPILSILCLILWVLSFRLICGCTDAVLYGTASVHPQVPIPSSWRQVLWGMEVLYSWRYLYPHMYGRNEVEIPQFGLTCRTSEPIVTKDYARWSTKPNSLGWKWKWKWGSSSTPSTSSEHHSDAARSGGEKVSSRLLLTVAASKERQ